MTAAVAALAAFGLYVWTAAPDLTLVDSGELALAAVNAAPAHPPGFPLWVATAHLATRLPLASPVRLLNLLSALAAALAAGALLIAGERLLAAVGGGHDGARRRLIAAGGGALLFATSLNPWTWSALTEVYALNLLLAAAAVACFATAAAAIGPLAGAGSAKPSAGRAEARAGGEPSPAAARWAAVGVLLGVLALANHHATAVPVLLALGLLLWGLAPRLLRHRLVGGALAAGGAATAALYLWLIPATARDPGLRWGGIDGPSLLLRHVLGQQYRLQLGGAGEARQVLGEFFGTLFFGCGLPVAALVVVALILPGGGRPPEPARRRTRFLAAALLALVGLNLLLSVLYVAGPEDRMAYDLPATIGWCLLAALGLWKLLGPAPGAGPAKTEAGGGSAATARRRATALVMLVGGVAWNLWANLPRAALREERSARRFVEETLGGLPDGGVVLTTEWNLYAPYLYLRHVEGYRSDLRVIDLLLLRRFWYYDYLERELPELVAASRREFDAFREQVTLFDLGRPYDRRRMQPLYEALVARWLEIGQAAGGAYVDWTSREHPQEASWMRRLPLAPDGLLLTVAAPGAPPPPITPKDAANLAYLRSRLTPEALTGDLSNLPPRHHPYWRVWRNYQLAVEASLLLAARRGGEALEERRRAYAAWYPEIDLAVERVRAQSAG